MASTALTPVEFHGATLTTTTIDGVPYVAIRSICEALSVDPDAQLKRIKRHAVLSTCTVVTTVQISGDDQSREVVMLPLDKLNGWLFGISAARVRDPARRERLTQYQAECFDVLARHFGGAAPMAPVPVALPAPIPSVSALGAALVHSIKAGELPHSDVAALAEACNMKLFMAASANKNRGYGEEVARKISDDMSFSDLYAINVAASLEMWKRTVQIPTGDKS